MDKKLDLVESYGSTFRDLINAKVQPTKKTIREVLKLSKDEDWAFLCSSMDIIGDACLAIDNFMRFGLDGPTKYNEVGERYLRLYGLLSATYIQQQAVTKLYQLVNVPPSLKAGKDMVDSLQIRHLRHKLSSHSIDYHDQDTDSIQTFVPVRMDLGDFNCSYVNNKETEVFSVDLREAINQHLETLIEMQDSILEKAIKTFYKGQTTSKGYKDFTERLEKLRFVKKGNLIFESKDGMTIRVIFASNESPQ